MPRRHREEDRSAEAFLPLSSAEFHILLAIADGERHGYGIMQEVRASTNGTIRLGPGTLYRCIQDLLRNGLIEESGRSPAPDEDQRRRYYRLSQIGRHVLSAETRRLADVLALAQAKRVLRRVPI